MTTPILQGESNGADAARLASLLSSDPAAMRLLSAGFSARNEDAALAALLSEAAEHDRSARRAFLSGRDGAHLMGPSAASVHIPTGLQNQFVSYANREMIADLAMPPVVVKKLSDKVWQLPLATMQQVANVALTSARARPGDVSYTVNSDLSYTCKPYGLIDFNDASAIANADTPLDLRVISAQAIKSFLDLAREKRVADVVFGASNYGTNTEALAGASRWDQPSSDPIAALLSAKESVFTTPNVLVLGGQVWPLLRTNPNVVKYILGRAGVANIGAVPAQMQLDFFAELIGVERVIVGRAKVLSNQEGGTASLGYLWGKSAALIRVEPSPNPRMTQCFGYTYRFDSMAYRNEVIPDRMPGLQGGEYIKMTHADAEVALGSSEAANPSGYLFTTVIS